MMSSPLVSRSSALLAFALASLLAACGGGTQGPASCTTTSQCAAGLTCTQSECLAPGQCPSTVQSCRATADCPASQDCESGCCTPIQGCASSTDCVDASRPHCDTASHACKPCASSGQCTAGKTCTPAGRCEGTCGKDADCTVPGLTKCRTGLNYCTECNASADCTVAGKPICKDGTCFGCTSNASCGGTTPVCDDGSKACVACLESQNTNGSNTACTVAGKPACVAQACQTCAPSSNAATTGINGACPPATPVCTSTFTCAACVEDSNCGVGGACTSGVCTSLSIDSFTAPSSTISAGGTVTLTVTLTVDVSASTDIPITIVSGGGSLASPTITIASGRTGTVAYTAPATAGAVQLKATLNGDKTLDLTVSADAVALAALEPATLDVQAGQTGQLTARLNLTPAADSTVTLLSGTPANATVPASVVVSGSDHASFDVTGVAAGTSLITGNFGVDKTATVTVYAVTVSSVTGPSGDQTAGSDVTMTVTLAAAPPTDAVINVSADNGATIGGAASGTITVAKTTTTQTFVVKLGSTGPVTVTAAANGSTQTATVTIGSVSVPPCAPPVVISGVYGGGGGTGTYKCDLIELHNRSASAQPIGGWSVQYASSTGPSSGTTTSATYKLPAVQSIPAGGYLLIQEDCGTPVSSAPAYPVTPDLVADAATTGSLSMAGGGGKVYLVSNQTAVTVTTTAPVGCPTAGSAVVDFVGWGGSSATPPVPTTCSEGMHPAPITDKTQAVMRNGAGCADTNDNAADFSMVSMASATPFRSSVTTPNPCSAVCQ